MKRLLAVAYRASLIDSMASDSMVSPFLGEAGVRACWVIPEGLGAVIAHGALSLSPRPQNLFANQLPPQSYHMNTPGSSQISNTMSSSRSHQESFSFERRKERAHMRLCYNIQRKVFCLRDKSRHWHDLASFYRGWRGRKGNRRRIDIAEQRHVSLTL